MQCFPRATAILVRVSPHNGLASPTTPHRDTWVTIQLSGLAFGSISLGPGVGENSSVVLVLGETVFSVPVRELQVDLTHNEQKDKNHNFNKWIYDISREFVGLYSESQTFSLAPQLGKAKTNN